MLKRIFILVFLLFNFSFGESVKLENIYLENLPEGYKQVFREFLQKNFNLDNQAKDIFSIHISWAGLFYNVCFDYKFNNKTEKISCFTAKSGEDFYEKFFTFLDKFKKTKPHIKYTFLPIKSIGKINTKKVRVVSEKRDVLVSYKKYRVESKEPIVIGTVNIDTINLNDENASNLLRFLLQGNKIKEILIIK